MESVHNANVNVRCWQKCTLYPFAVVNYFQTLGMRMSIGICVKLTAAAKKFNLSGFLFALVSMAYQLAMLEENLHDPSFSLLACLLLERCFFTY